MLSIKEYDAIKEGRYRELKEAFDKLLAVYEGVPSVKGFDKVIRDTKKRIKALEVGSAFAKDDEEVKQAEIAMARRCGELWSRSALRKCAKRKLFNHKKEKQWNYYARRCSTQPRR